MKIYVTTRQYEVLGPFSLDEVKAHVGKHGKSWLHETFSEFWSDDEHVLPKGLQWDWDGSQWRVFKKRPRTPEQEREVEVRNSEYARYLTELWRESPDWAYDFASLLPPEREQEYNEHHGEDRERRRLRGLRPYVSPTRYNWERFKWHILVALILVIVLSLA